MKELANEMMENLTEETTDVMAEAVESVVNGPTWGQKAACFGIGLSLTYTGYRAVRALVKYGVPAVKGFGSKVVSKFKKDDIAEEETFEEETVEANIPEEQEAED